MLGRKHMPGKMVVGEIVTQIWVWKLGFMQILTDENPDAFTASAYLQSY